MRLKSLTHLEADALREELAELEKKIANYEAILGSTKRQYGVIKEELLEIKKRMSIGRMSTIVGAQEAKETQEAVPTAEERIEIDKKFVEGMKEVSRRNNDGSSSSN